MLIKGIILPSFTENKMFMNPGETRTWIESELLPNRDAQKFLFLNQFSLKKIFDQLCKEASHGDDAVMKEAVPLKRKNVMRRMSKRRISKIESIAEEPESASASLKSPKTPKINRKLSLVSPSLRGTDELQSPLFSSSPGTGKILGASA